MPSSSPPAFPEDEFGRLAALRSLELLDTDPEQPFDDIVALAAELTGCPTALISLVDSDRQWFKAKQGMSICQTPRKDAFCNHAIRASAPLVVEDATADPRFSDNPLVTGSLGLRFYAGVPVTSPGGYRIGTLCVKDYKARKISAKKVEMLVRLAHQVSILFTARWHAIRRCETLAALMGGEEGLRKTLTHAKVGLCEIDLTSGDVTTDPSYSALLGFEAVEKVWSINSFLDHIYIEDREGVELAIAKMLQIPHQVVDVLYRGGRRLGGNLWLHGRGCVLDADKDGQATKFGFVMQDVTGKTIQDEMLRQQERQFRMVVETMQEGVIVRANQGGLILANESACQMLGVAQEELSHGCLANRTWQVVHEDGTLLMEEDHPSTRALKDGIPQRGILIGLFKPDDESRWVSVNADPIWSPGGVDPDGVIVTLADVTETKRLRDHISQQLDIISDINLRLEQQRLELEKANKTLARLATTDGLTGLVNHRRFQEFLAEQFESGNPVGLILLDADNFKSYNDTFGHPEGDKVLKAISEALTTSCPAPALASRYGGEEFTVVLPGCSVAQALQAAELVRLAVERRRWRKRPVTVSVGVAVQDASFATPAQLIAAADRALYESKHAGRNRVTGANLGLAA